jgi:hypothetical protein
MNTLSLQFGNVFKNIKENSQAIVNTPRFGQASVSMNRSLPRSESEESSPSESIASDFSINEAEFQRQQDKLLKDWIEERRKIPVIDNDWDTYD